MYIVALAPDGRAALVDGDLIVELAPRFLGPGSRVAITITSIGTLTNDVIASPA